MYKNLFLVTIIALSTIKNTAQQNIDIVRLDSDSLSYLFHITQNKTHTVQQDHYYWFKSGRIHKTQGSYYGKLLHGNYKVFNSEGALLEEGRHNKGKKTGLWRTWYENGNIQSTRQKRFPAIRNAYNIREYDSTGKVVKKGFENRNGFSGYRIIEEKNNLMKIRYRKGEVILPRNKKGSKN